MIFVVGYTSFFFFLLVTFINKAEGSARDLGLIGANSYKDEVRGRVRGPTGKIQQKVKMKKKSVIVHRRVYLGHPLK